MLNKSMFQDVKDVMHYHGVPLALEPTLPTDEEFNFRATFLDEELNELHTAFIASNIVDMADAIADLITVAMGLAASMGLPLEEVCKIVNYANLNGKEMVPNAAASKRNYAADLRKTTAFIPPEPAIARLLFGEDHA